MSEFTLEFWNLCLASILRLPGLAVIKQKAGPLHPSPTLMLNNAADLGCLVRSPLLVERLGFTMGVLVLQNNYPIL